MNTIYTIDYVYKNRMLTSVYIYSYNEVIFASSFTPANHQLIYNMVSRIKNKHTYEIIETNI